MPSPLLSIDQVRELTEPYHGLWTDAYRQAAKNLTRLRDFDTEAFLAYESSTLARMMRDHTVRRVKQDNRVVGSSALQTFTQIINGDHGTILVRFKELDPGLRRFNHVSGRQDRLDLHSYDEEEIEQLQVDGLQHMPTLISCGYVRNMDFISVGRIVVVCHYGRSPMWHYDLESGALAEVRTLPGTSQPPAATVRSRIDKKDAAASEED